MEPKTLAAMERGNISRAALSKALGRDSRYIQGALLWHLSPENAGEFVRALAELTHLTTKERREIFHELTNYPDENPSLHDRI